MCSGINHQSFLHNSHYIRSAGHHLPRGDVARDLPVPLGSTRGRVRRQAAPGGPHLATQRKPLRGPVHPPRAHHQLRNTAPSASHASGSRAIVPTKRPYAQRYATSADSQLRHHVSAHALVPTRIPNARAPAPRPVRSRRPNAPLPPPRASYRRAIRRASGTPRVRPARGAPQPCRT